VVIDFFQLGVDLVIIVRFVRKGTICTAFDVFRAARVFEIPSALVAQKKERAKTKQAIESLGIAMLMAREISASDVSEKFVAVVHTSPSDVSEKFVAVVHTSPFYK